MSWTPWAVFVTVVSVQLVVVVVGSLVSVIGRHVCRKEVVQPSTLQRHIRGGEVALPSSSQRSNLRDVAALFNVVACVTRVLYITDPGSERGLLPPRIADALLLRVPQLLWMTSFSLVVVVWSYVLTVTRVRWLSFPFQRVAVPVALCLLFLVSIPAMLMHAEHLGGEVPRMVATSAFAAYATAIAAVGGCAAYQITRLLSSKQLVHSVSPAFRVQLAQVIRLTARTMVATAFFSVVLVIALVLSTVYRLRPHHSPKLYLVFLVVVHAVVEAGIAFTLLYTTWISPPWLVALCNCGGSQAAAAAGAGRRDDVSTPGSNSPHNSPLLTSRRGNIDRLAVRPSPFYSDNEDDRYSHTRSMDDGSMDQDDLVLDSFFLDGSPCGPDILIGAQLPSLVLPQSSGTVLEVPRSLTVNRR